MSRILEQAVEQVRAVETVLVIVPAVPEGNVRVDEELRILRELGYRVERVRARGRFDVGWPGRCLAAIVRERPCLVHAHGHGGTLVGALLGRLFRIPSVADLGGSLTDGPRPNALLRTLERWIDRLPDHLVASSRPMAEDLRARFAVPPERITVIPDAPGRGLDTPSGDRERGGMPRRDVVVAIAGGGGRRGAETLLETIGRVLHARADVSFVVLGPGPDRLRSTFARSRSRRRVAFAASADARTVAAAIATADLAVSVQDAPTGSNAALLHFMAAGVPTVAFDTPVHREILGELGIWARGRTAAALARRVIAAVGARERVRELRPALLARAAAGATWDRNRRLLADVYGRTRGSFGARRGAP